VFSIAKARHEKWMVLKDPKGKESYDLRDILIDRGLGLGEAYSIALAKELRTIFLANDKQAIEAAREYGIETRWSTEILQDALKRNYIKSVDEYIQILDSCINQGLYVSKGEKEKAIGKARAILPRKDK
jgi:predicted nucleic acid-binding protein